MRISKRKATYLGAILIIASFIFYAQETLSFGHPDVIAPYVAINTDTNIAKKQGANFQINYSATDAYGSLSSCALHTSDDEGNNWIARGTLVCEEDVDTTIDSAWCPNEGTSICGVRITATDKTGNRDQHEKFFTIDGRPPIVELSSNRSDPSEKTNVTFTFWASDEHGIAHTSCGIDTIIGPLPLCVASKSYSGLKDGVHEFRVIATDIAGNFSEKSISWEIDSLPPKKNYRF